MAIKPYKVFSKLTTNYITNLKNCLLFQNSAAKLHILFEINSILCIINLRKCIIYLEVTKKKHNFAQILIKMLLFENNVT